MGIYGWITKVRNHAFDKQWVGFKTKTFPQVKSICVGNLSVGGTGKTPMVVYLTRRFLNQGKTVVVISLGYKRRKLGSFFATAADNALTVGDEPAMYLEEFNRELGDRFFVYLCKRRAEGVAEVLKRKPQTDVILFDDGYQHRYVKAGKNILLTACYKPFFQDRLLPYGRLREHPEGARRADVVVMTKCPSDLSEVDRKQLSEQCASYAHHQPFFSRVDYREVVSRKQRWQPDIFWQSCDRRVILVTGIASARPLVDYLKSANVEVLKHFDFADHHRFTMAELREVEKFYFAEREKAAAAGLTAPGLLTTQKDYVRLLVRKDRALRELPWHYISIMPQIMFGQEEAFLKMIEAD